MKYLRLFESHAAYEAAELEDTPCVVYDGAEVHYVVDEPTDTTTIVE